MAAVAQLRGNAYLEEYVGGESAEKTVTDRMGDKSARNQLVQRAGNTVRRGWRGQSG
ncbi:hypothetical protein PANT111_200210 [Pantoea brenneri]|uniref:Uncharacterized protein n=1 Tax=Pantoea brenneri TaxID=472694 RepID=A0AAX3J7Y0_9GAMM|nr:hypothetical protein PANT111_200210 [Pantoea brenneri]